MSSPNPVLSARARVALAVRRGNAAAEAEARIELAAARVRRAIDADLASLRDDQRLHLAAVLVRGVAQ